MRTRNGFQSPNWTQEELEIIWKQADEAGNFPLMVAEENDIISHARPAPKLPGIYYLLRDYDIVYVGQAIDIDKRIKDHVREGIKKFDSYYYQYCPVMALDDLEAMAICKYQPEYNVTIPKNNYIMRQPELAGRVGALTQEDVSEIISTNNIKPVWIQGDIKYYDEREIEVYCDEYYQRYKK
jgi:hypothetical protein